MAPLCGCCLLRSRLSAGPIERSNGRWRKRRLRIIIRYRMACLTLVQMLHGLLRGQPKQEIREIADRLAETHSAFRFEPYPGRASAYIADTMQTVFRFYFGTASFADCVIETVNQGGDADTTGALAGMLAGAAYGLAAIPAAWVSRLDRNVSAEIKRQVPQLLAISAH